MRRINLANRRLPPPQHPACADWACRRWAWRRVPPFSISLGSMRTDHRSQSVRRIRNRLLGLLEAGLRLRSWSPSRGSGFLADDVPRCALRWRSGLIAWTPKTRATPKLEGRSLIRTLGPRKVRSARAIALIASKGGRTPRQQRSKRKLLHTSYPPSLDFRPSSNVPAIRSRIKWHQSAQGA